ncbi:DUF4373 domain-containing protein [Eubacterium sp.]|uniref:DUF4373 domain-containing protein n=1 Tax=Eubacterium sp. TaxID=142586 RepID=UPI002FCB2A47
MARPFKSGIDYFPFDVDLLNDRKLRKPKMKYGYLATMVYIALLVLIYKDKGYYIDYSEEVQDDVHLDILDFLQGKHQPEIETVGEVIQDLVACELFSRDCYSEAIITSHRLQCTYYRAVAERKRIEINWDIWLLDEGEMRELGSSNLILTNFINLTKNGINPPNNPVNETNSTQSKGKERKGNKRSNMSGVSDSEPVASFILKDGSMYEISRDLFKEFVSAYPSIDILDEMRKIALWCKSNPAKRKTRRGALKFVNGWLNRATPKNMNTAKNGPSYDYEGDETI